MSKKKAHPATERPARHRWAFGPDIPTDEWLAGESLNEIWNFQEAVATFVYHMERGCFLTWEAVAREEQGLPLTAEQEKALDGLINFNDEDVEGDDRILEINGICRPSKPWDATLNQIAPHLRNEPFVTSASSWQVKAEGFPQLMKAIRKHGQSLSLPPGVTLPEELIPAVLRHKLWLQVCFDDLSGLGQEPENQSHRTTHADGLVHQPSSGTQGERSVSGPDA